MSEKVLEGKTGLIFGVANKRSIAWGIARAWAEAGATLILNYQSERLREGVEDLAQSLREETGVEIEVLPCDVSDDEQLKTFFAQVAERAPRIDFLLHSVAFAPREALDGRFVHTEREAFRVAHDVSVYSLVALAREAKPLMKDGGSILAMTFLGSQRVVPHYNVMGVAKAALEASVRYLAAELGRDNIRVNAISAGPMQTLSARGIAQFSVMLKYYEQHAPLRRSSSLDELGATGLYLVTDGAAAITGQTIFVDGGYSVIGMPETGAKT
jgi:enoyl-[acyl-carrier protein] reductase I